MAKFIFVYVLLYFVKGYNFESLLPDTKECGRGTENKIVGGRLVDLDEFPWLALLLTEDSSFVCGGSLINNRYVLTAAHCFGRTKIDKVRLGEYNLETSPDCVQTSPKIKAICAEEHLDIKIEEIIPHDDFNRRVMTNTNDIALIRLAEKVNFTRFIKPICVPNMRLEGTNVGDTATVAGWGKTETRDYGNIKLKVELPVTSNEKCSLPSDAHQLCAGGEKGKDSCSGDSGGPLMVYINDNTESNWYITGIVQGGFQNCGEGLEGIYTKVVDYYQWIVDNIKP